MSFLYRRIENKKQLKVVYLFLSRVVLCHLYVGDTECLKCVLVAKCIMTLHKGYRKCPSTDVCLSCLLEVKTGCDGTRAETTFGLPVKRTSPFISAGVSVQSSTGFFAVRVEGERL